MLAVITSIKGRSLKKRKESHPLSRQKRLELERGSYLKKWKGKVPVALVYPNTYGVGMSSLGFQLVYSQLNERNDLVCERFFLPEKGQPFLSMESGRRFGDFALIFLSISFEHDYSNIVKILLYGGLEPFAAQRQGAQDPLVICGGVATFMNPEPIAPFCDLMVIGEAEPVLDPLTDFLLAEYQTYPKQNLLHETALRFEGIYSPELYTPVYDENGVLLRMEHGKNVPPRVRRLFLEKCSKAAHSELLTPEAEFSDLFLTELGRGCSRGCRFCAAGFIYRPPRLWDADSVVQGLLMRDGDVKRIGMLGMEMADSGVLENISSYLLDSGCSLSFSSLRADKISDNLLSLLSQSSLKSVAIAPDGTSERLRKVINKGLDESDILSASARLVDAGIFKLKLYVMVGLPTESSKDLEEFVGLVRKIKAVIDPMGQKRGRLTEIFLSINCFVPKPWTPFQYHPFGSSGLLSKGEEEGIKAAITDLKNKISYLKKGVKGLSNIYFQADKPENALFQAVLSKGDRRLANVLYDVAARATPWKSSMKSHALRIEQFVSTGQDEKSYFPWYIIDHGVQHEYLWKEYVKSMRSASTEPCDISICRRCGVCGEREE